MKVKIFVLSLFVSCSACAGLPAPITVSMSGISEKGVGDEVGHITISESEYGLVFSPSLKGLEPGVHGFHIHENASCEPGIKEGNRVAGLAAGGHFDPKGAKKHGTPWGDGHLGDLAPLFVAADGTSDQPVLSPRVKLKDLVGRSLMIHAGGDNHSDHPSKLGGGGARVSCGVVEMVKK